MNEIKYERIMDMAETELEIAESKGAKLLEETIYRMEGTLKRLNRILGEYREGGSYEKASALDSAAGELRNCSYSDLSLEIAGASGELEQMAKLAQRLGILNK